MRGGLFRAFLWDAPPIMGTKAVRGVVVYWDLAALWNFLLDYLLLLGTLRIAGRPICRVRLACGAAIGAAYSVAALALPLPPWTLLPAAIAMTYAAFGKEARRVRLTLLFFLLACALGGAVLLLGRFGGGMERLALGVLYARIPWGVFLAASCAAYLLLTIVFRGGAKHDGTEFARAEIEYGGRRVAVRLLRDTGNTLCDPLTGEGVPVVEKCALAPLFRKGTDDAAHIPFTTLHVRTVGGADATLEAFRCDALTVDARELGARLIALSTESFCGAYQGLWYNEEREETERHELETSVG